MREVKNIVVWNLSWSRVKQSLPCTGLLLIVLGLVASCGKVDNDTPKMQPEILAVLDSEVVVTVDEFEQYLTRYSQELRASSTFSVESLYEQFARKKLLALDESLQRASLQAGSDSEPFSPSTKASVTSVQTKSLDTFASKVSIGEQALLDRYERDKGRWKTRLVQLEQYTFDTREMADDWLQNSRASESGASDLPIQNVTQLGWLSRTSASGELRSVVSLLSSKQEFSGVRSLGNVYAIYHFLAEQNNVPRPLREVRDQIVQEMKREIVTEQLNARLDKTFSRMSVNQQALMSLASRYAYEPKRHTVRVPVPGRSGAAKEELTPKTGH